ncbi:MAG: hypothetical protein ACXW3C_16680 [Pyrinomonadaceae bacterium]
MLRRINLSAAIIVLLCFFLPWEQISCGGARDSVSGFDLARHDHISLWLIPLLMFAVLVVGLLRRRAEKSQGQAIVGVVSGAVTAYLMNDQRVRIHDAATIIPAQLTGWFWLGFLSALALTITAVGLLLSPRRAP